MKAILSFFSLLFLLPLGLHAQNKEQNKTQFGFIAGPNFTKSPLASYTPSVSSWNSYTESHYDVGLNIGAFVSLPLGTQFSFQPELGFSLYRQNQLYSDDYPLNTLGSISNTDKLSESSVTLDALLKYKTKYFSISAGPQMGMVTAANTKTHSRSNAYNGTFYSDTETNFSKDKKTYNPVFSLLFGLGKDDIFNNLDIGVYYNLGLSNHTEYYQIRQITKVSGFQLQFSYTIEE